MNRALDIFKNALWELTEDQPSPHPAPNVPDNPSNPFFTFRYSRTEISVQGLRAHVRQSETRFENGSFCRIDCSRRAVYGYDQRVEVFGSKGMVCSANMHRTGLLRFDGEVAGAMDRLQPDFLARYLSTYAVELKSFIEAVVSGAPVTPDFVAGRRALALADGARESVRLGRPVVVNLKRGETRFG